MCKFISSVLVFLFFLLENTLDFTALNFNISAHCLVEWHASSHFHVSMLNSTKTIFLFPYPTFPHSSFLHNSNVKISENNQGFTESSKKSSRSSPFHLHVSETLNTRQNEDVIFLTMNRKVITLG